MTEIPPEVFINDFKDENVPVLDITHPINSKHELNDFFRSTSSNVTANLFYNFMIYGPQNKTLDAFFKYVTTLPIQNMSEEEGND